MPKSVMSHATPEEIAGIVQSAIVEVKAELEVIELAMSKGDLKVAEKHLLSLTGEARVAYEITEAFVQERPRALAIRLKELNYLEANRVRGYWAKERAAAMTLLSKPAGKKATKAKAKAA